MRISDWSSDVCSSDLAQLCDDALGVLHQLQRRHLSALCRTRGDSRANGHAYARTAAARAGERGTAWSARRRRAGGVGHAGNASGPRAGELHRDSAAVGDDHDCRHPFGAARSEEHTSELQALIRISYADSDLTKKPKEE